MNLKKHADFFKKIQDRDLKKSLLPEQVIYNGKIITAPDGWRRRLVDNAYDVEIVDYH